MKVVNVVLSILILLLAVASAVFSFFLFEKRTQLVEGWAKLSTTISKSATEMDKGSGTQISGDLTAEELAHEKFVELDGKLVKLTDQTNKLMQQRDKLAATLQQIGSMSEMGNVPSTDALKNLTTYSTSKDDVVNGVGALLDRRNRLAQSIVNSVKANLNINADVNKLRAADSGALEQLGRQLKEYGDQRKSLEAALNEISNQAGSGRLSFAGNDLQGSLNKVKQAVNGMKSKLTEAERTVAARNQDIQRQKSEIANKNNEISGLKQQLGDKNFQLDGLRTALGIGAGEALPVPWRPGSPEARKQLVGRVADVSSKYGYIAIDLGSDTTVSQQLGDKTGNVNVNLEPGLEMLVSRNDSEFVAKVKLTKVENDCSIAEPIGVPGSSIRVGDKVIFDIN